MAVEVTNRDWGVGMSGWPLVGTVNVEVVDVNDLVSCVV